MKALAMILRFGSLKMTATRGAPPGKRSFARVAGFGAILVSVALVQPPFTAAPSPESINTYAADCATAKTTFFVGDTVCAVATDAPLGPPAQRLFEWVMPGGSLFQSIGPEITTNPQSNSITIPAGGPVGTWQVKTVDRSNNGQAVARFVVQDPANAAVDLWCPVSAPFEVSPGSAAPFNVFVTNKGPNDAQNVQLTVGVATNSTFQSETQVTGPAFNCTNPDVGSSEGTSTCSIATLPANTTAQLTFVFQVDSGAQPGAGVSMTATVSSDTPELFDDDNTFTASVTISSPTCEVTCPGNITDTPDTGQCGKVVNFATPSGSGSGCGTVECNPASGTFFPIGTTNVVCSGDTGGGCAFTVTIRDTGASISCPANIARSEDSPGLGYAVVNYPAPAFPDSCSAPTAACDPPSGSSFPVGTTTVNCQTTNSSGAPLSCSFTVTVNSQVCIMICPDDVFASENPPGSGSATVTYSSPTPSGCPSLTVTCTPPSGSSFPVGSTTVNCAGKDGSNITRASCSFVVTVSAVPCTLTCSANVVVSEDGNTNPYRGAVVTYPAPTTQNCSAVTIACSPPSGSRFPLGTTAVTCNATNGSGNNVASCSFTVTVNSNTPCVITCPANVAASSDAGQCGAVVNYAAPTTNGNCGSDPPACSPTSGSFFPNGSTTVICLVAGETQCSFTVTVTQAGTTSSAKVWVGLKNSDDVGTKFDLLAEVFKNGEPVALGQLNDVPGGSSSFNNAVLDTINLALTGSVSFSPGDVLTFRLSVRVAASSSHVNGTARLWFNDSAANSRISGTVCSGGTTADQFLLDGFALGTSAGPGPKKTIDVTVNRNVGGNPFKPFATWTKFF